MSLNSFRAASIVTILFLSTTGAGCSYLQPSTFDEDFDLAELDDESMSDSEDEDLMDDARLDDMETTEEVSSATAEVSPRLKSGDRIPLVRTIEQKLTQSDSTGTHVSTSRTEIQLTLVVDDILKDGRKQMTVTFEHVKFEQISQGRRVAYTSDLPTAVVPPEAFLYSGLTANGFSFWLDSTNRVSDVVGFSDFLKRCLINVPQEFRTSVERQLRTARAEDGVANFIDDSIGLLPYRFDAKHTHVAVPQGTEWDLDPRRSETPVPLTTQARCRLSLLSERFADIRLAGEITGSSEPVGVRHVNGDFSVTIQGGSYSGTCRIDRQTGLPVLSQIERSLDLMIEFPDGQQIKQNKLTQSTLSTQSQTRQLSGFTSRSSEETSDFQNQIRSAGPSRVVRSNDFRQN